MLFVCGARGRCASGTSWHRDSLPCLSNPISWRGTYARAYDEVKALGGDGTHTPTVRTADQTYIGIYWAYDGTPSLCALPRSFSSLSQAEEENGQSRIYLGIH